MPLGSVTHVSPLFIVGAGRSGTTLLQIMLNAHPEIAVFGETQAFFRYLKYGRLEREYHLRRFLRDWVPLGSAYSPFSDLFSTEDFVSKLRETKTYSEAVSLALSEFSCREGKTRWGEKTPAHVLRLRPLLAAFPRAKIIHIVRDPRAVVSSAIRAFRSEQFTRKNAYLLARFWQERVTASLRLGPELNGYNYREVSYENLVTEPERVAEEICRFIDLEFHSTMLSFHAKSEAYLPKEALGESGHHRLIKHEIGETRISRWSAELAPELVRIIENVTEKEMCRFGYRKTTQGRHRYPDLFASWVFERSRRRVVKNLRLSYWTAHNWLH